MHKPRRTANGWQFRAVDPVTHRRVKRTETVAGKTAACEAFRLWLRGRQRVAAGLPDESGWTMPYATLVQTFLAQAPIATERRRKQLRRVLERNELHLQVAADLAHTGALTQKLLKVSQATGTHYARFNVQAFLKQLTAWAASARVLPTDPLAHWARIAWEGRELIRRPLEPHEMAAILERAEAHGRAWRAVMSPRKPLLALLLTGARPTALLHAKVRDLRNGRIYLPAGQGRKRNGQAALPAAFFAELQAARQGAPKDAPLFVGMKGTSLDRIRLGRQFNSFLQAVGITDERVDMYCLRATHITWARARVNPDSVRSQVGHAGRDVEERHYLGVVDPRASADAVWTILQEAMQLQALRKAAGVENLEQVAPFVAPGNVSVGPWRNRGETMNQQNHSDGIELRMERVKGLEPSTSTLARLNGEKETAETEDNRRKTEAIEERSITLDETRAVNQHQPKVGKSGPVCGPRQGPGDAVGAALCGPRSAGHTPHLARCKAGASSGTPLSFPEELRGLAERWPTLPANVRAAILTLAGGA